MEFSGEFGLKERGSLDGAIEWAKMLEHAVDRWAPQFTDDQHELDPYWVGTGVASAGRSRSPANSEWTAVAILETGAVLRREDFRALWRHADQYMRDRAASFAALVVGPVRMAADAVIGSSVGVPRGCMGTLGGAVASGSGCVALTAGHVVSPGPKGGIAQQPASAVDGPQAEIGRVIGWSELRRRNNSADVGLISLHPNCDGGKRDVFSEQRPEEFADLRVRKTGAKTGTTSGRVTLIGTGREIRGIGVLYGGRRKFFNQLLGIEADGDGERFAWYGDSGALIFREGQTSGADEVIGMVVAASAARIGSSQPVGWAVGSTAISASMNQILRDEGRTEA
jgi:hypothetical protein